MKDRIKELFSSRRRDLLEQISIGTNSIFSSINIGTRAISNGAVAGKDKISSFVETRRKAAINQIEIWMAGGASTIKIVSGDFRPGRAAISMDGIKLRNRDNSIELIPFSDFRSVSKLMTEKRGSTLERIKGITAGGAVGVSVGAIGGMLSLGITGPLGLLAGGALGLMLSARQKFHTCVVEFHDQRIAVAVGSNTTWLALIASIQTVRSVSTAKPLKLLKPHS